MIKVQETSETLFQGIDKMIDAMIKDYAGFNTHNKVDVVREKMQKEYADSFKIKAGQKYIKVTNDGSVKAFINIHDGQCGKFKKGDILKPASWAKPATNSARGNVLNGNYAINWTGPLYLK